MLGVACFGGRNTLRSNDVLGGGTDDLSFVAGILVANGNRAEVSDNTVRGFGQVEDAAAMSIDGTGVRVTDNVIESDAVQGIVESGKKNQIVGNRIEPDQANVGSLGIRLRGSKARADGNTVQDMRNGLFAESAQADVSSNTFTRVRSGIFMGPGASRAKIAFNRISILDGEDSDPALAVAGESCRVFDNEISGAEVDALVTSGSGHILKSNDVHDCARDAIHVESDATIVKGNTVSSVGGDGIDVRGARVKVISNTVDDAGDEGIELDDTSSDCLVKDNTITGAGDAGIQVEVSGHVLIGNTASGSGTADLVLDPTDVEVVLKRNSFGTIQR